MEKRSPLTPGPDGKLRCHWCDATPEYRAYHDTEWGYPVKDDSRLFEKLCLEGFQAGLSWRTILSKRDHFRKAFAGFDIDNVAAFTERDLARLLGDTGIVRHRGKIESVINNARRCRELIDREGSLASFVWGFEPVTPPLSADSPPPAVSLESIALSKQLKKGGWRFVGPTTVYAFMQAMGLVNDHAVGCVIREEVERARRSFTRPVKGSRPSHRD